jgi:exodeoxyribonuclease V alpha subunit
MNRQRSRPGPEGRPGETGVISGSVESVIYTNEENGYTVFRLSLQEGGIVTVVGTLPYAAPGEEVTAEGHWTSHQVHGNQFQADKVERLMPATVAGIYQYLSSGVIKGVGPATARNIVEAFGEDALRILEESPERLSELKGIPLKRAQEIGAAFRRQSALRRLLEFFAQNEIRLSIGIRMYRSYGDDAMSVLYANPYLLCDEYFGASFAEADRVALKLGFEAACPERVEAAVLFELNHNANNGHCFIPEEKLVGAVSQLIGVPEAEGREAVERLTENGETVREDIAGQHAVYMNRLYRAETEIARRLLQMAAGELRTARTAEKQMEQAERELGVHLAENQRRAVREAMKHGVFVLTGGPGTGKTTTIRAILKSFDALGLDTALAAPTGRAAKRMQEMCSREASTIHRLLETGYDPELGFQVFHRDEDDPLHADAVILDEASMVDVILLQALLRAMKPGCRLVLVGDADQLPSVGPGNLLRDLLRSEALPAVRLEEVFRQAQESVIVRNAHLIDKGEQPDIRQNKGDFFFLRRKSGEAAVETILELCAKRLPEKMGIPQEDIQVLSPSRRYVTGTAALNKALQEALNPQDGSKPEKSFGEYLFRQGDRVMQIRNNYDLIWTRPNGETGAGVYNGDVGRILAVDPPGQTLTVEFEDRLVQYTFDLLGELEPAFAMTVHKSQGSEYRAVILALGQCAPSLLSRAVLYTAVTRAKELLIVVGDDEIFAAMVANNRTQKRYSGLKTRLAAGL